MNRIRWSCFFMAVCGWVKSMEYWWQLARYYILKLRLCTIVLIGV